MSTTPDGPTGPNDPYRDPTAPAWTEPVAPGPYPGQPDPGQQAPAQQVPPGYPTQEQLQQQAQPGQPAYPQTPPPAPGAGPYPYGQHGYGQPGYGQPGYGPTTGATGGYPAYGQNTAGYGYPPPGAVSYGQNQTNGSALALTIVSAITVLFCGGLLTIPAVVFGGIALARQNIDPESSRRLARNGWIAYGVGVLVSVILVVAFFAFFASTATDYSSTYDSGY